MLYDLSGLVPFLVAIIALAALAAVTSLSVVGSLAVHHHRTRVARHQTIPTYYRRLVLAH